MAIKINVELIKTLRNQKAWSQEQLADIAGISLRAIQRIEKCGSSSLESKKAIASAFDIKASDLDINEKESALSDDSDNFYFRVEDGSKLTEVIGVACAFRLNHDNPNTEEEADLLASAAQSIHDWGDIWNDIEAGDRVKATFELTQLIQELESEGFWVFAVRTHEEYLGIEAEKWPIGNVFLMRSDNPRIIKLDLSGRGKNI